VLTAPAALLLALSGAAPVSPAAELLHAWPGVTAADLAAADEGQVVVRMLDTPHRKEVAALSLMRVRASRSRVLQRFLDLDGFKQAEEHLADVGRLGDPPAPADLARLGVEADELKALARCRPGDCGLKLPAAAMARLQGALQGPPGEARARVAAEGRSLLAEWASAYLERGDASLPDYDDRPRPVSASARAGEVLAREPRLAEAVPELDAYLRRFPAGPRPDGLRDLLFWSQEVFWKRKVLTLGHLLVCERAGGAAPQVWRVSKQLFARNYFEAALHAAVFVETPDGGGYLAGLLRFETDHKRGGFNFVERALVNRLARRRLERQQRAWRELLEADDQPRPRAISSSAEISSRSANGFWSTARQPSARARPSISGPPWAVTSTTGSAGSRPFARSASNTPQPSIAGRRRSSSITSGSSRSRRASASSPVSVSSTR
jgi:hypothetical protein